MLTKNLKRTFSSMPKNFPTQCLINNKWVDSVSKETFATINPATGEEICKIAKAGPADVDIAVDAANHAFKHGEWSKYNPSDRRNLLMKLADNIEKNKDEFCAIETTDNGKGLGFSLMDVDFCLNIIRF
jgi:acyl-CoA reductase-like NAD-dependent aldehyde dehydrogenase